MLKEVILSVQAYFKAHQLISSKNNYKILFLVGFIYAFIFAFCLYFFYKTSTTFTELLIQKTNIKNWLQSNNSFLTFIFGTAIIMFNLVLLIYYFGLIKYIVLIGCSPLFSYLSIKTKNVITNENGHITFKAVMQLAKRSSKVALQNFLWQSLYCLFFLFASLLPVVGWVVPIIALLYECFFYGNAMLDYSLAQKSWSIPKSQHFLQHHKGFAIGNGIVFYILHLIPVLGWVVAPIYSIIAATITTNQQD